MRTNSRNKTCDYFNCRDYACSERSGREPILPSRVTVVNIDWGAAIPHAHLMYATTSRCLSFTSLVMSKC